MGSVFTSEYPSLGLGPRSANLGGHNTIPIRDLAEGMLLRLSRGHVAWGSCGRCPVSRVAATSVLSHPARLRPSERLLGILRGLSPWKPCCKLSPCQQGFLWIASGPWGEAATAVVFGTCPSPAQRGELIRAWSDRHWRVLTSLCGRGQDWRRSQELPSSCWDLFPSRTAARGLLPWSVPRA